jgi:hypothetical protein
MASYSVAQQQFLIGWQDTRGGLWGQYLQTDATAVGTATNVNFSIANASVASSAIAYNNSYTKLPCCLGKSVKPVRD